MYFRQYMSLNNVMHLRHLLRRQYLDITDELSLENRLHQVIPQAFFCLEQLAQAMASSWEPFSDSEISSPSTLGVQAYCHSSNNRSNWWPERKSGPCAFIKGSLDDSQSELWAEIKTCFSGYLLGKIPLGTATPPLRDSRRKSCWI